MSGEIPLQDRLHPEAPIRGCYGCGADNSRGLRIKSFLEGDEAVCKWLPEAHHISYPGYLNGGIACTLIDCHSAWAAFALECQEQGLTMEGRDDLPTGWTRAMKVEFLRPVPVQCEVVLRARLLKRGTTSRTIACSLSCNGEECVKSEVTIVMAGS